MSAIIALCAIRSRQEDAAIGFGIMWLIELFMIGGLYAVKS